jgi:hypothetical protein
MLDVEPLDHLTIVPGRRLSLKWPEWGFPKTW